MTAACGSGPTARPTPPPPLTVHCPRGVLAALPPRAPNQLFVRPRALYEHPQLGRIVARAFDDASERALIHRAEQYGYDARTLDRAAIAWTAHNTLYIASGPLDAARVAARFWERLLPPRRRTHDALADQRLEGVLGTGTSAALFIAPACTLVAYEEGPATRTVDRIIAERADRDGPADPEEPLLVWRSTQLPAALAQASADTALVHFVRELRLEVTAQETGLTVRLTLRGTLPDDAPARIRRALAAVAGSPLGELAGASAWLVSASVMLDAARADTLVASTRVPWPALRSLADAIRGSVGDQPVD